MSKVLERRDGVMTGAQVIEQAVDVAEALLEAVPDHTPCIVLVAALRMMRIQAASNSPDDAETFDEVEALVQRSLITEQFEALAARTKGEAH